MSCVFILLDAHIDILLDLHVDILLDYTLTFNLMFDILLYAHVNIASSINIIIIKCRRNNI